MGYHTLRIDDRRSLRLDETVRSGSGDSFPLQKGLVMLVDGEPVCGEGVGFGVPALEYSDKVFFSTSGMVEAQDDRLTKCFWIDAFPRKTWRKCLPIENGVYVALQSRLAKRYRTEKNRRPLLTSLMKLQSLMGVRLSFQRVMPRGFVKIVYRLASNKVRIDVNYSALTDRIPKRLLLFNEQSGDFDLYEDSLTRLRNDEIGVWELSCSERARLTNNRVKTTFCVEPVSGAELYRGREILKPRLDWSGFCYATTAFKSFCYAIEIN